MSLKDTLTLLINKKDDEIAFLSLVTGLIESYVGRISPSETLLSSMESG